MIVAPSWIRFLSQDLQGSI